MGLEACLRTVCRVIVGEMKEVSTHLPRPIGFTFRLTSTVQRT